MKSFLKNYTTQQEITVPTAQIGSEDTAWHTWRRRYKTEKMAVGILQWDMESLSPFKAWKL